MPRFACTHPSTGRVTLIGPAERIATGSLVDIATSATSSQQAPSTTERMSTPYNEALGATLIERTVRERIVLVGVTLPGSTDEDTEASLDELALLIDTAGADEVGRLVQRRDSPDHTWFIGKGKVEELKRAVPRRRRRHRRVRQRARPRPSSSTWRSCSGARRSTAPR